MRNIIDIVDKTLTESVGLANRRPGEQFQNATGDVLTFQSLDFFPDSGAFESPQLLSQAVETVAKKLGIRSNDIVWTNAAPSRGGFGIAHFTDAAGNDTYFGRYFKSINPNRTQNNFPNNAIPGYSLQSKSAKKETAGYKPSDVLSRLDNLSPADIVEQVTAKFGADSDEARAMQIFVEGSPRDPIPLGNMNYAAFTNYFCEMLQPMALLLGKPTRGNAGEAEAKFLGDQGFASCVISFGGSKTQGLVDSILTNPKGRTLGISTKAKGGAKASVKNLAEKIQEMTRSVEGTALLNKYQDEIDILQMISQGGYINGPLNLAVKYKIINAKEADQIRALKGLGNKKIIGSGLLSPRLERMYQARGVKDPKTIVPFYHMLAAIAYPVADYINNQTNFGEAASTILNFGAFIQGDTRATRSGDTVIINEFDFQYPSTAVTSVLLSAAKTYYSTDNKGNFTFKILKNGASEADVDVADHEVDTKPDPGPDNLIDAKPRRSAIKAAAPKTPKDSVKVFGRRRQR